MNYNLIYCVFNTIVGMLLGWFLNKINQQKYFLSLETKRISLEQKLKVSSQALINEQHARKEAEIALRAGEQKQCKQTSLLAVAEERVSSLTCLRQKFEQINQELLLQRKINTNQEIQLKELIVRLEENRLSSEKKQAILVNNEEKLSVQFENLANRIFESNGRKISEQNRYSLDQLLIPLREQLDGFRRQIQESFGQESRERYTLVHEIKNLQKLNSHIAQEAISLARIFKGNNKTQGNWGELVLNKILEMSGLRKDYEFKSQINMQQWDGQRLKPDVIVCLPQGKDIIIDAKVSLISYERYLNSNSDTESKLALDEHINSLRTHIKLLSRKDYQQLPELRSFDYVLMFIPIEPAFILAIGQHPELINEALSKNIMLTSPTTLLVALRTINNLWRYEHQNRNAQHIADRATRLYDKLRLFIDDINTIGQNLNKAQANYQSAKNKLFEGRGNIISQAEDFRVLGVEIKKPITFTPKDTHATLID